MINEMKKAGLASAFAAAAFAIGIAAGSVSPAVAADGSFATRVQELNQHASASDQSGYYAYAPYSYADMTGTSAPSIDANGSFSSRIQNANRF